MPTTTANFIPVFVFSGQSTKVSVPAYDADPTSNPADRALWSLQSPAQQQILSDVMKLGGTDPAFTYSGTKPSTTACRNRANEQVQTVLGTGYRAVTSLVEGRTVNEEGRWIPTNGDSLFGYGFLIEFFDQTTNTWREASTSLRIKSTYLVTRPLMVIQGSY